MGYHKTEYYVCDWCGAQGAPAPNWDGPGSGPPDDWSSANGPLLCGGCLSARRKALDAVREERTKRR